MWNIFFRNAISCAQVNTSESKFSAHSSFAFITAILVLSWSPYARCLEFESHCKVSIPPGSSIDVGRLLLREMGGKSWKSFYEKLKPKAAPSGGMLRKMSGSLNKLTSASRRALQVKFFIGNQPVYIKFNKIKFI